MHNAAYYIIFNVTSGLCNFFLGQIYSSSETEVDNNFENLCDEALKFTCLSISGSNVPIYITRTFLKDKNGHFSI